MSNIFIVLIILHCLGDYYLQTKNLAEQKDKKYRYVVLHSLIYSIPAVLSILLFKTSGYALLIAVFCAAHFLIDSAKYFIKARHYFPRECTEGSGNLLKVDIVYFVDQFLHIAVIIALAAFFMLKGPDIAFKEEIIAFFNMDTKTILKTTKTIAAFAVILKPVSLTFYKIFNVELMAETDSNDAKNKSVKDVEGAGEIIGYMERIIMSFLLIMGEYTAMGLVIAGKSIIRLNSNIKQEFFLIGTFYGIITTLMAYILFFIL